MSVSQPPSVGPATGPDHHAQSPDRHRLAAFVRWIGVGHDGLRQRHQRRAEHALQQPEEHDLREALRDAAQRGRGDEAGDADRAGIACGPSTSVK